MKKNLINLMIILMVAIISLCVSCSKDDDSPKDETVVSIVGTWRYDWGSSAVSFTAYTFNSDGSGFIYDKGNTFILKFKIKSKVFLCELAYFFMFLYLCRKQRKKHD